MANRLARESSPYLLQHADNPVDWYPWGEEAFAQARKLSRPILLSIGYSACHWCHVMARESFSDPETAALMNDSFINVKVDREERPDVDAIYMAALQTLTGSGGWPLTAVLTPDGEPFFAGTYWPDAPRHGLPDFRTVLRAVIRAWDENPAEVADTARELTGHLRQQATASTRRGALDPKLLTDALEQLQRSFDSKHGGFGTAPKFPPHSVVRLLLGRPEASARNAALTTLRHMARGGIFDQLGGGLARYTVDEAWLVPHFEKMLFDSAQFLGLCASAAVSSGETGFRRAALLGASWLLHDMRTDQGTFRSARSAESDGIEGEFYLWTQAELRKVLEPAGLESVASEAFGASEAGNHEGRNILTLSEDWWQPDAERAARLEQARSLLFEARARRNPPEADDKVLTSWNGLTIENLALAGRLLGEPRLTDAARSAAAAFLPQLDSGTLRHTAGGDTLLLEDVAFLGNGLLGLYQADLDPRHLAGAARAAEIIVTDFSADGSLYSTAEEGEQLLYRPRGLTDSGAPADTAEAARLLLAMSRLSGTERYRELALATLEAAAPHVSRQPTLLGSSLAVIDSCFAPAVDVVFAGAEQDGLRQLTATVQQRYLPHALLLHSSAGSPADWPLLEGRAGEQGSATAWLCVDRSCRLPVSEPAALARQLDELTGAQPS